MVVSAEPHFEETPASPTRGDRGTRRRDEPAPRPGPLARALIYYREIVSELRKVIYPTRSELVTYTIVVIVFVAAMIAIVAGLDYGFSRLDIAVFG